MNSEHNHAVVNHGINTYVRVERRELPHPSTHPTHEERR